MPRVIGQFLGVVSKAVGSFGAGLAGIFPLSLRWQTIEFAFGRSATCSTFLRRVGSYKSPDTHSCPCRKTCRRKERSAWSPHPQAITSVFSRLLYSRLSLSRLSIHSSTLPKSLHVCPSKNRKPERDVREIRFPRFGSSRSFPS